MTTHGTRAHAVLSASGAERWLKCPGSVRMSAGLPDVQSEYAAEGTAAHELAQKCIETGHDPAEFIGDEWPVGDFTFTVTDEMAEAVDEYVEAIEPYTAGSWEWAIEQRLDLSSLYPGMFGTADFVAYNTETHELVVVDFKYGRGVVVSVEDNPQLLYYGLGAARAHHNRGLSKITLKVVQPRAKAGGDSVRAWSLDAVELLEWSYGLIDGAKATEAADAPLAAGEWCRFCKASPTCPALQKAAFDAACAEFNEAGEMTVPDPSGYDSDQLALALKRGETLEVWLTRVREIAHAEATAGRMPTGFKLVAKRATWKWKDEGEAKKFFAALGDEAYERKFLSPTKIEAIVAPKLEGKTKKAKAEAFGVLCAQHGLVSKVSSGTVLAPEDDPRPSVRPSAAEEFGSMLE